MLGLLGLRFFEATGANIADLGEEHGHRVLRVCGKGGKVVQIPLPPAVGRAIDRPVGRRTTGPSCSTAELRMLPPGYFYAVLYRHPRSTGTGCGLPVFRTA
jgi:integrase